MNNQANRWILAALCIAALPIASAKADFVNGGFESGDTSGWTLDGGRVLSAGNVDWTDTRAPQWGIVGNGYVDTHIPAGKLPINDNYTLRIGDPALQGNWDATKVTQTATMSAGTTELYINWAAVMVNPIGHTTSEQPFFEIDVQSTQGNYSIFHTGDQAGWNLSPVKFGTYQGGEPVYWSSGTDHLQNLVAGDSVTVTMVAGDCDLGAHGSYAFLDGIGSNYQPPNGAPDGGVTGMLLGTAFIALGLIRRRMN